MKTKINSKTTLKGKRPHLCTKRATFTDYISIAMTSIQPNRLMALDRERDQPRNDIQNEIIC